MNIFTVSFFGHRIVNYPIQIEQRLEKLLRKLLSEKEYVEFLVGRDGDFDQIASSAVRHCKKTLRDDNSALVWVMPYEKAEFRKNERAYRNYCDEIEVCESSSSSNYKSAFQNRNRSMVDRSDLVVFCIEHNSGGAYQTMRYAQKQGKNIINLADNAEEI